MPLCLAPWANLDISPQGHISPCCKFQASDKLNIQTDDLGQYFASDFLIQLKQSMVDDQWHPGCIRCQVEEENGIESMRKLSEHKWRESLDQGITTASIAFGNTCNLKCITCNAYSSSKWHQEYQDVYGIDFRPVKFYRDGLVQTIVKHAPNLRHLDIPGGEPLLSGVPEQHEMLEHYIRTGQSHSMSLHYTTNATMWPDDTWWHLWSYFGSVEIQLSIDGVGARNEYIRFPSIWADVEANVGRYRQIKLHNFKLSISHTVSAYNIFYLDEFVSWCYNQGLPEPWLGKVHKPAHMRPSVWPNKSFILDRLAASPYKCITPWIKMLESTDDSDQFAVFKRRVIEHDQYRGTSFDNTFPELSEYLV